MRVRGHRDPVITCPGHTYTEHLASSSQFSASQHQTNMQSSASLALTLVASLATASSLDQAEVPLQLLRPHIAAAQCAARCVAVPTPASRAQCEQVCEFRARHPDTDLCSLPGLCGDLGCQVGCQELTDTAAGLFSSFARDPASCRLSWALADPDTGRSLAASSGVVFLVAARDHSRMWSVLEAATTEAELQLGPDLGLKYSQLAVVAVSRSRVLDTLTLRLPSGRQQCGAGAGAGVSAGAGSGSLVAGVEDGELVAVLLLSALVLALLLLLVGLLCCWRRRQPALRHLARPGAGAGAGKCGGEGSARTAVDNSYVAFPHLTPTSSMEYIHHL